MELQDHRCHGLMVGLAAGNLLGIPCEGRKREEIRLRWPDGVRDIEAKTGYPDDDDLAQAVILAAACHGAEALDADDLARRFWVWGEENGLGMGHATHMTLAHYGGSPPRRYARNSVRRRGSASAQPDFQVAREPVGLPALEASRAAWEDSGGKAAGNGAVMRCAPLAIRWRHDDAALVRNTACSAVVTHWDSRCVWSAVFVNLAIASLLREPPDSALRLVERAERARETLGDALVPFGIDTPVPASVTKTLDAADVTVPEDIGLDGWGHGLHPQGHAGGPVVRAPGRGLRGGADRRHQRRRGHRHKRRRGGCGAWCTVWARGDSQTLARPGCQIAGRPGYDGGMGRPSDGNAHFAAVGGRGW